MIQRIQSIWLLLAAVCGFATLSFPFYFGSNGILPAEAFSAKSNNFLLIVTVAASVIALVDIFLFANRNLQVKIAIPGLVLSIVAVILSFILTKKYTTGTLALSSVFVFLMPLFYLLAIRGIWKDQKLVKSVDRLR